MSIESIHNNHSLWTVKNSLTASISSLKKEPEAAEQFSDVLKRMIGNGTTPHSSANGGDGSDDQIITLTKVLDDGSTMVTVLQGKKVISQTTIGGNHTDDEKSVKLGLGDIGTDYEDLPYSLQHPESIQKPNAQAANTGITAANTTDTSMAAGLMGNQS